MKRKTVLHEMAVQRFKEGYNCAQSVLLAFFEQWDGKNDLVPKIASGFGGGIGRCGSICGALAGGIMAIGIKYGTNEPSIEKRTKSYELAQILYKRFKSQHGSVMCRELIGYDLSHPKGLEMARNMKVFEEKCPHLVRTVTEILLELDKNSN
jgi:C_GCAxxG_C_C family probable redox protein